MQPDSARLVSPAGPGPHQLLHGEHGALARALAAALEARGEQVAGGAQHGAQAGLGRHHIHVRLHLPALQVVARRGPAPGGARLSLSLSRETEKHA